MFYIPKKKKSVCIDCEFSNLDLRRLEKPNISELQTAEKRMAAESLSRRCHIKRS